MVFGLLALLLWGYLTFQWPARGTRIAVAVAAILAVIAVAAISGGGGDDHGGSSGGGFAQKAPADSLRITFA